MGGGGGVATEGDKLLELIHLIYNWTRRKL